MRFYLAPKPHHVPHPSSSCLPRSQVPAVAALLAALAALNQRLQPLYDAWRGLQKGQEDLIDM